MQFIRDDHKDRPWKNVLGASIERSMTRSARTGNARDDVGRMRDCRRRCVLAGVVLLHHTEKESRFRKNPAVGAKTKDVRCPHAVQMDCDGYNQVGLFTNLSAANCNRRRIGST